MKVLTNPAGEKFVGVIDSSAWQFKYDPPASLRPGAKFPNFEPMVQRGIAGLIHRIGNGRTKDAAWDRVCVEAERVGMPLSGYYYLQPNRLSAAEAARKIIEWADGHKLGLPMMLDCEHYDGAAISPYAMSAYKNQLAWLLAAEFGVTPIVYTFASWWAGNVAGGEWLTYDSVQARYPRSNTRCPSNLDEWMSWIPWSRQPTNGTSLGPWEAWQFTSSGYARDFGFPDDGAERLDLNIFRLEAFERMRAPFTGGGITQPPPPPVIQPPLIGPWTAPVTELQGPIMENLAFNLPKQTRLLDTRNGSGGKVAPMTEIVIPRPSGTPDNVKAYALSVILIEDDQVQQGNIQFMQADGTWVGSQGNTDIGLSTSQSTANVPAQSNGSVVFRLDGPPMHVVVDLTGYYTPIVAGGSVETRDVTVVTGVTTENVRVVK